MKSSLNIKDQILECLSSHTQHREHETFAFCGWVPETKEFEYLVTSFLKSKTYIEAERRGRRLMHFILTHHDKLETLAPVIDDLNLLELYWEHNYAKQRLHFCHLVNVYLLGLYIYHNFKPLREQMDAEMQRTTPLIEKPHYGSFRFSGGSEYGEFLYRWRMAALCHDLGTGIQLCLGKKDEIARCLEQMPFNENISSVDELWKLDNKDLVKELDSALSEVDLSKYIAYQDVHPFQGTVHHDHGIMSALIFLRLMHEEYARHSKDFISHTRFGTVVWYPEILSNSILQIATVMAMHNLEKHSEALEQCAKNVRIFDMQQRPLSWLLKITDLLQEWDKPFAKEEMNALPVTNMALRFSDSEISVKFPKEKRDTVLNVLRQYTTPNNAVSI